MSFLGDEAMHEKTLHDEALHGKTLQQPLAYVPPIVEEIASMTQQPSTPPLANQQPSANQPRFIQQPQPPLEYTLENNETQVLHDEDDNVCNSSSSFYKVYHPLPLLYAPPPSPTHVAIQPSTPDLSTSALAHLSNTPFPHASSSVSDTNTENSLAPASSSTRSFPPSSPPPSYEQAIRAKEEEENKKGCIFNICIPLAATLVCGIIIAVLISLALSGEECTDTNVCFYQANLSSTGVFLIPPSTWVYKIERLVGLNALTIDPLLWPKLRAKDISSEKRTNTTMLQNVSIFYKPNPRSKTCSGLLGAPRTSPQDFANENLVASTTNTYPCTAEYWVGIACILVLLFIIWALYMFSKRERDKSESSDDRGQEQEQETNKSTTSNLLLIAT